MAIILPDTVKIVNDLVKLITPSVEIKAITDLTGSYKVELCNSYYLKVGMEVEIGGTKYKITEVVQNEYIIIEKYLDSDPDPVGSSFTLDAPFFIHGTIRSTKTELDNIDDSSKYPMVYLYEVYRERGVVDPVRS